MRHLRIYENFIGEVEPEIRKDSPMSVGSFET